jgi:hypothetical protein
MEKDLVLTMSDVVKFPGAGPRGEIADLLADFSHRAGDFLALTIVGVTVGGPVTGTVTPLVHKPVMVDGLKQAKNEVRMLSADEPEVA